MNCVKIVRTVPLHIMKSADGMLDGFFKGPHNPSEMSYNEMLNKLYEMEFAHSWGWSREMRSLGHEVHDVCFGFDLIQEKWADEHGLEKWERNELTIVLRQINYFKPDVLWLHSYAQMPYLIRLNLKQYFPFIKMVIAYAVDNTSYTQMKNFDLVLCDKDYTYNLAKKAGANAKVLYNGFDKTILERIEPVKFGNNSRPYDFTFVGSSGFNLGNRYKRRYWTLVELARKSNIKLWAFDRENPPLNYQGNTGDVSIVNTIVLKDKIKEIISKNFIIKILKYLLQSVLRLFNKKAIVFFSSLLDLSKYWHYWLFESINNVFTSKMREVENNMNFNDAQLSKDRSDIKNLETPAYPIRSLIPDSCNQPVFGIDMFKIWKKSKLTLNSYDDSDYEVGSNPRMYETTGVGSCLVSENTSLIKRFFEPDYEIITYDSVDECIEKVSYLLDNDKVRIDVAKAGQNRTLTSHNYKVRCEQLNEYLREIL